MKNCILIALVFWITGAHAQHVFNLYKDTIPNSKECAVKEVWTDAKSGRGNVKQVTVPTLKVYMPADPNGQHPAVIICPGGGYASLSIFDGGYETAEQLSSAGIVAFVLKYRVSDPACNNNKSIAALQDAQQAMYVIKKNARKWHVDPQKIGYVGFSAGGHHVQASLKIYQSGGHGFANYNNLSRIIGCPQPSTGCA